MRRRTLRREAPLHREFWSSRGLREFGIRRYIRIVQIFFSNDGVPQLVRWKTRFFLDRCFHTGEHQRVRIARLIVQNRLKDFWAHLKHKAKLPVSWWSNDAQVSRYQSEQIE